MQFLPEKNSSPTLKIKSHSVLEMALKEGAIQYNDYSG